MKIQFRSVPTALSVYSMLALRIAILIITVSSLRGGNLNDDLQRFQEIGNEPGLPYRETHVEYAPVQVMMIKLLGSADPATTGVRIAILAFAADIGGWLGIRWGWGSLAGKRYLLLGAPLLVFSYTRFDLVPVAIAAWATALAVHEHHRFAGSMMGIASLAKLWPAAIIPSFLVDGKRRAFGWAVGSTVALTLAWVLLGGVGGVEDVLTFRHASGWGVESVIGTMVWILGSDPVRIEQGAPRVGSIPDWASIALALLLTGALAAIWVTAYRRRISNPYGSPSVAAVAAVLVCSPLLSLQYVIWLVPWAAVSEDNADGRTIRFVTAAVVLTAILYIVYQPDRAGLVQVFLLLRNTALVCIPVVWFVGPRVRTRIPSS